MLPHGANLSQKENHKTKYKDDISKQYLSEIRIKYQQWHEQNTSLKGPLIEKNNEDQHILECRVNYLNDYKDFIDQQKYAEKFDSRSNLHSTVLEEFMYYLFKDLVSEFSEYALIGKSHSFKDIFFLPSSYRNMLISPQALIERKDHDFAIGVHVDATLQCRGQTEREQDSWDIPAVAVECKTYLDKTMLQDASTAAVQLKNKNPNALYIVVAEWLKLTNAVNLRKYQIDQVYVLRKQKNTDREFRYLETYVKNPIYSDVVIHLFETVREFLSSPSWEGGVNYGLQRGYLI
ncbi:bpu10I restriction endonuclease family protein [Lyngbya aestuarii BL J]|uniref:Bpu10I restriction endonuclease family protein n=1 Tax=Lyngbya aestuarii BL J TaxID=1348334 RepID=U7QNY8_9CYAN|nr:Bpu10I family restriction endonuclease [Lyngbya aestuarii]ERT08116.1 bpu10I restriction endonuclease family protein [Lyngbya aestuarii BL J]